MVLLGGTEDKRHPDILTTLVAPFSVTWHVRICCRIIVARRWCVPSLLTSGSEEKQMVSSSEIKALSGKRPWKESPSTQVWYG